MTTDTLVDQLLAALPPVALTVEAAPLTNVGPSNLIHYLMGTQEPWTDRPANRTDFLLRTELVRIHRLTPDPPDRPAVWADLVAQAQNRAAAMLNEPPDLQTEMELGPFLDRTRRGESDAQIKQRVWLAIVMYNLGHRGLSFDRENGAIFAQEPTFGAPIGIAPDLAVDLARARGAERFYVATYAERFRETEYTGEYPVDLARGRGRMRWYVHEVRIDPRAERFYEIERNPVERTVALIVAGDEHATRAGLPRDYYRDPAFQQAVIDAEDRHYDKTLVLSPRHGLVALDQIVQEDGVWEDLGWWNYDWAWKAQDQLWRACLNPDAHVDVDAARREISWWVWQHPESRYRFTLYGHSRATQILAEILYNQQVSVETHPGYVAPDAWGMSSAFYDDYEPGEIRYDDILSELGLDESLEQDLRETLTAASEEAAQMAEVVFLPPPSTLNVAPRMLSPEEALEPVMVLRARECEVDQVVVELQALRDLLDEPVNIGILMDAPTRLTAVLRIVHAVLHGDESEVMALSEETLPARLHEAVRNAALDLEDDRLCPLLSYAEGLSALAVLLDDDDRDRLSVWQRTFWAGELRHNGLFGE